VTQAVCHTTHNCLVHGSTAVECSTEVIRLIHLIHATFAKQSIRLTTVYKSQRGGMHTHNPPLFAESTSLSQNVSLKQSSTIFWEHTSVIEWRQYLLSSALDLIESHWCSQETCF